MNKFVELELPIKTVGELNLREHWAKSKKRHDDQKIAVRAAFMNLKEKPTLPCSVLFKRIGKRKLDSDNLIESFKWIRDALADKLIPGKLPGRADDSPLISWEYTQETGKDYSVVIKINF